MIILKTRLFEREAERLNFKGKHYDKFIEEITCNPHQGDVIPNSNGLRKIRTGLGNRGKRGGGRVIYKLEEIGGETVVLLYFYSKGEKENITGKEMEKLQ